MGLTLKFFIISDSNALNENFLKSIKFKRKNIERALRGNVQSVSKVESFEENSLKMQQLNFKMVGIHPNRCKIALRKISLYEEYSDFIGFIKKVEFTHILSRFKQPSS